MKAFDYFLKLNEIPRGSYNEKQVANFMCEFAKERNLEYKIDEKNNVKIFKNNNSTKTVILQAHLDMVCEKLSEVEFDFENMPIQTIIENDFITANGTTLGADDGFGVALIMEILSSDYENLPNIEAVFTVQEEVGMDGAKYIDCGDLKGKYLIGLDGTNSSELIVSCAGSCRLDFEKDFSSLQEYACKDEKCYTLKVGGLLGGHSGEDINKQRANANKIAFDVLQNLNSVAPIYICSIAGGGKDNAIPREFECRFLSKLDIITINSLIKLTKLKTKKMYKDEIDVSIVVEKQDFKCNALTSENTQVVLDFVNGFENGVLELDSNKQVVSSINLANISLSGGVFSVRTMLRFNNTQAESKALEKYVCYANSFDMNCLLRSVSPFFEMSKDCYLQNICSNAYYSCGFEDLKVLQIHAGLEGGIFAEKIENLQVVVLGADLYDIHTPNEKMRISSLEKLSKWLYEILANINKSE